MPGPPDPAAPTMEEADGWNRQRAAIESGSDSLAGKPQVFFSESSA